MHELIINYFKFTNNMKAERFDKTIVSRTIQSKQKIGKCYLNNDNSKAGMKCKSQYDILNKQEFPIQNKQRKMSGSISRNGSVNQNVIQNVLVTDVPDTGDFSQVTDLGIWWAMAAEWHFQQTLPANAPNLANLNPLNYIHSLNNYLPGAVAPHPINVAAGDRVRMQAHGYPPNRHNRQPRIHVMGGPHPAIDVVNNIDAAIVGGRQHVTPLYCYMGNNVAHRYMIPGIDSGPMLSPSMGSVSLVSNMENIRNALRIAGAANTWNNIINDTGMWIPINEVDALSPLFNSYVDSIGINGVNNPLTTQRLIQLLNTIYNVVNQPYNDFANYLIQQHASTGRGPTLWQ